MIIHDKGIQPKEKKYPPNLQVRERERCRVRGSEEINRFWSAKVGPLIFCSFRCSAIGTRYIGVMFTLVLFLLLFFYKNPVYILFDLFFLCITIPYTIYGFIAKRGLR